MSSALATTAWHNRPQALRSVARRFSSRTSGCIQACLVCAGVVAWACSSEPEKGACELEEDTGFACLPFVRSKQDCIEAARSFHAETAFNAGMRCEDLGYDPSSSPSYYDDNHSPSPSGSFANGGNSAGGGLVCTGTAYTRTDVPGTGLCLSGPSSFECAFGHGNPTPDGVHVRGTQDSANNQLTLFFPDDSSAEGVTGFVFSLLFDTGGADLVLDYQGSRAGEYREVGSWAEAVAGDQGACSGASNGASGGGGGGGAGGETGDCGTQEAMLSGEWITEGATRASDAYNVLTYTLGGGVRVDQFAGGDSQTTDFAAWSIASTAEGTCDKILLDAGSGWMADYSKIHELTAGKLDIEATDGSYYGTRTRYDRLGGPVQEGESATCGDTCEPEGEPCSPGEGCLLSPTGYVCYPTQCQGCWDAGQACNADATTCAFFECTEPDQPRSPTCQQSCDPEGAACTGSEACLNTAEGYRCVASECGTCWAQDRICNMDSGTCVFGACAPP